MVKSWFHNVTWIWWNHGFYRKWFNELNVCWIFHIHVTLLEGNLTRQSTSIHGLSHPKMVTGTTFLVFVSRCLLFCVCLTLVNLVSSVNPPNNIVLLICFWEKLPIRLSLVLIKNWLPGGKNTGMETKFKTKSSHASPHLFSISPNKKSVFPHVPLFLATLLNIYYIIIPFSNSNL